MRMRRPRVLSEGESRLWNEIAKLVTPLRGRAKPAAKPVPKPEAAPALPPSFKAAARMSIATGGAKAAAPLPAPEKVATHKLAVPPAKRRPTPPLPPTAAPYQAPPPVPVGPAGLERQARLALRRGTLAIDARIDLHGMYQGEAHDALIGFLRRARAAGHAHVLVVTGKGGAGMGGSDYADAFSERGVLRRSVPHWLRGPDLRGLVLGFEEASRHHGGSGALYVRLKRR